MSPPRTVVACPRCAPRKPEPTRARSDAAGTPYASLRYALESGKRGHPTDVVRSFRWGVTSAAPGYRWPDSSGTVSALMASVDNACRAGVARLGWHDLGRGNDRPHA